MAEKREDTFTKTIWQYTEELPRETMEFLQGIAVDCGKVKAGVYQRYSGVKNLGNLSSTFDIMTQMRHCGLRERLNLPSVYYELAVRDAVADIKGMWSVLKNKIRTLITANENFSPDDRMYLRTVLKLDNVYAAILNHEDYTAPEKVKDLELDPERLNNYLRRLTRKYLSKPVTGRSDAFCVSPQGYSYKDRCLYLASRERRKRVKLPLRDEKTSSRQIRICLKENRAAIAIPVEIKRRKHQGFHNTLYIHLGYQNMCTLSTGSVYGSELGSLSSAKSERLMKKTRERNHAKRLYRDSLALGDEKKAFHIAANNLGTFKYDSQKKRERARIETYVNTEINRMLETEEPERIVITKPITRNKTKFSSKTTNRKLAGSLCGYVRKRLTEKCAVHSIELVEISSKGTGEICSSCGGPGRRLPEGFVCESCGYQSSIPLNGARNIERKYKEAISNPVI
ncbi:zinc ribbon domain-containing protein [Lachnospiraceae bacterium 45-P1]